MVIDTHCRAMTLTNRTRSRRRRRPNPVIVVKPVLGSGGSYGLVNAVWTLIGFVFRCKIGNVSLVLPSFVAGTPQDNDTSKLIPFERLFQVDPFVSSLAHHGVTVLDDTPKGAQVWHSSTNHNLGLHAYFKHLKSETPDPLLAPLEGAVYDGLVPSARLTAAVRAAQRDLLHGEPFGCIHARIEKDIQRWWRRVARVKPVRLHAILSHVGAEPTLTSVPRIFVAVGRDIHQPDHVTLKHNTSWGAELVRRPWTTDQASASAVRAFVTSYVEAATFDFFLCRAAAWFVGWDASSFSLVLGRYRVLAQQRWWSYCAGGLVQLASAQMHMPQDNTCLKRNLKTNQLCNAGTIAHEAYSGETCLTPAQFAAARASRGNRTLRWSLAARQTAAKVAFS